MRSGRRSWGSYRGRWEWLQEARRGEESLETCSRWKSSGVEGREADPSKEHRRDEREESSRRRKQVKEYICDYAEKNLVEKV